MKLRDYQQKAVEAEFEAWKTVRSGALAAGPPLSPQGPSHSVASSIVSSRSDSTPGESTHRWPFPQINPIKPINPIVHRSHRSHQAHGRLSVRSVQSVQSVQ